jgi:predicted nucleic acid-binding protein
MYVFDTNVISEVMKDTPDAAVAAWLRACPVDAMFTTTICQSEILYGVRRLSQGRRRARLLAAAEAMFARSFADRVLPFDAAAASACVDIRIARERAGRPVTQEDGMIAAIAKVAGFTVLTRDEAGFAGCGVPIINPWRSGSRGGY